MRPLNVLRPVASPNCWRIRGLVRVVIAAIPAGAVLVAVLTATIAPASGADEKGLNISGADNLELLLAKPTAKEKKSFSLSDDDLVGTLDVDLYNSNPVDVAPAFELVRDGTAGDCVGFTRQSPAKPVATIAQSEARAVRLTFTAQSSCVGTAATLLVNADDVAVPFVTAPVKTVRSVDSTDYARPLLAALIAGLGFFIVATLLNGKNLRKRTPSGPSWSFGDSWLTSITALSTALAAVLAASGLVAEILPGVPLGHFLGLELAFGGLIVAAPMVFAVFESTLWEAEEPGSTTMVQVVKGSVFGLIFAGALTCAGVTGQLAILGQLVTMSRVGGTGQVMVLCILAAAFILLAAYVASSTLRAVKLSADSVGALPDGATKSRGTTRHVRVAPTPGFSGTF